MKVKWVCSTCGSDSVLIDAWAIWNVEKQEYELENVFEHTHCIDCDGECNTTEVIVKEIDG